MPFFRKKNRRKSCSVNETQLDKTDDGRLRRILPTVPETLNDCNQLGNSDLVKDDKVDKNVYVSVKDDIIQAPLFNSSRRGTLVKTKSVADDLPPSKMKFIDLKTRFNNFNTIVMSSSIFSRRKVNKPKNTDVFSRNSTIDKSTCSKKTKSPFKLSLLIDSLTDMMGNSKGKKISCTSGSSDKENEYQTQDCNSVFNTPNVTRVAKQRIYSCSQVEENANKVDKITPPLTFDNDDQKYIDKNLMSYMKLRLNDNASSNEFQSTKSSNSLIRHVKKMFKKSFSKPRSEIPFKSLNTSQEIAPQKNDSANCNFVRQKSETPNKSADNFHENYKNSNLTTLLESRTISELCLNTNPIDNVDKTKPYKAFNFNQNLNFEKQTTSKHLPFTGHKSAALSKSSISDNNLQKLFDPSNIDDHQRYMSNSSSDLNTVNSSIVKNILKTKVVSHYDWYSLLFSFDSVSLSLSEVGDFSCGKISRQFSGVSVFSGLRNKSSSKLSMNFQKQSQSVRSSRLFRLKKKNSKVYSKQVSCMFTTFQNVEKTNVNKMGTLMSCSDDDNKKDTLQKYELERNDSNFKSKPSELILYTEDDSKNVVGDVLGKNELISCSVNHICENGEEPFLAVHLNRNVELYRKKVNCNSQDNLRIDGLCLSLGIVEEVSFKTNVDTFYSGYSVLGTKIKTPPRRFMNGKSDLKGDFNFECVDSGCNYYRNFFVSKDHTNYACIDEKYGPVIVSTVREVVDEKVCGMEEDTFSHELGGAERYQYRIIVRTADPICLRISILESKIHTVHYNVKHGVSHKALLSYILPNFPVNTFKQCYITEKSINELLNIDEHWMQSNYKFGIIYCKPGQSKENEFYYNQHGSPNFDNFLGIIGRKTRLRGFKGFNGGLDVTNAQTCGEYSVFTRFRNNEIMFHVSTLLPYRENDLQSLARKRYIGNNIVTIIFQEEGCEPFDASTVVSKYQQVFVVIKVEILKTDVVYRVAIVRASNILYFGPPLRKEFTFKSNQKFRDFILTKCINAENAVLQTTTFKNMRIRYRLSLLNTYCSTFATSKRIIHYSKLSNLKGFVNKFVVQVPHYKCNGAIFWNVMVNDVVEGKNFNCKLCISSLYIFLVNNENEKVLSVIHTKKLIAWTKTFHDLCIYYNGGECILMYTNQMIDIGEIECRLESVSCAAHTIEIMYKIHKANKPSLKLSKLYPIVSCIKRNSAEWNVGVDIGYMFLRLRNLKNAEKEDTSIYTNNYLLNTLDMNDIRNLLFCGKIVHAVMAKRNNNIGSLVKKEKIEIPREKSPVKAITHCSSEDKVYPNPVSFQNMSWKPELPPKPNFDLRFKYRKSTAEKPSSSDTNVNDDSPDVSLDKLSTEKNSTRDSHSKSTISKISRASLFIKQNILKRRSDVSKNVHRKGVKSDTVSKMTAENGPTNPIYTKKPSKESTKEELNSDKSIDSETRESLLKKKEKRLKNISKHVDNSPSDMYL